MNNYLYRTTNIANGKTYIGVHTMDGEFGTDNYMGSGTHLLRAIKKYGKNLFKSEVLCNCESREEVAELEELIVNEDFVKRSDTYNLRTGGDIDFKMNGYVRTAEHCRKIGLANTRRIYSAETRAKMSANCGVPSPIESFLGRPIRRSEFKLTTKRKGLDMGDFSEVDTGLKQNNNKLYTYDWS